MNIRKTTLNLTLYALFTALIAIGAFIKVPIPVVPFTLQFLFTMMAGILLGPCRGMVCVCIYIALGLAGLPIFAQGGGFWYIFNPNFGYLIGFAVASFVTGELVKHMKCMKVPRIIMANLAGLAIVYLFGMIYYYIISNFVIDTPIGLWTLFLYCFLLAVPGDICLCVLAAFLTVKIKPIFRKMEEK